MLRLEGVTAGYGNVTVLRGVDLTARAGEITCVMGRNGAGKTTLLKCIMGLVPATSGTIALDGMTISRLPAHRVPAHGVALVPQGRRLFGPLTVEENLQVGLLARGGGPEVRAAVLALFPRLAERLDQRAATLSGGEQQMLAIARALCLEPRVLLLDEPTEGLQPSIIATIQETVARLRETGVATVLVEQRTEAALRLADRVVFLAQGQVGAVAERAELGPKSALFQRFVGV